MTLQDWLGATSQQIEASGVFLGHGTDNSWDEALHLTVNGATETLFVANPAHIQQYHVANIAAHLRGERPHPSVGLTAARATEVMAQILASGNKKAG